MTCCLTRFYVSSHIPNSAHPLRCGQPQAALDRQLRRLKCQAGQILSVTLGNGMAGAGLRAQAAMSTVDAEVETPGAPLQESDPPGGRTELTSARLARVGDVEVRRLLPLRRRRSVGAWCFVDHYGPMSVDGVAGMQVPPHPHIGLQTVTWLIEGNVLHRDSLGSEQMIRPGQLNLMTAGHGHVIFVARGSAAANGNTLAPGSLLYLATGRGSVTLTASEGARLFLLGGEPLGETLLMWWNFVGRTPEDI